MPQGAASNQERREYDASDCPLREASMRLPTTGILLLGAVALATSASAQTPPAPSAITRTVIAAAKLPSVTDVPLHFRAVAASIPRGEKCSASPGNSILYQLSGTTQILAGAETRTLTAAEGLFVAAGTTIVLNACGGDHCPRNRRWSWRGLRTGGGGKCHCAEQQYSGRRQSHLASLNG